MTDKKQYHRDYFQREDVKEKNADRMAKVYATDEGQAYEHKKRRTARSRFKRAEYGAKRRGKDWTISYEVYAQLITKPCYHCNVSLYDETGSGLDRIDNERGYHVDNVNPCCKDCNRRRSRSMDAEEFKRQTALNKRWKENG